MQITGNLKSIEKDLYKKQYSQKLRFYIFTFFLQKDSHDYQTT